MTSRVTELEIYDMSRINKTENSCVLIAAILNYNVRSEKLCESFSCKIHRNKQVFLYATILVFNIVD